MLSGVVANEKFSVILNVFQSKQFRNFRTNHLRVYKKGSTMDAKQKWKGARKQCIVRFGIESVDTKMVTRPKVTGGVPITVEQAIV